MCTGRLAFLPRIKYSVVVPTHIPTNTSACWYCHIRRKLNISLVSALHQTGIPYPNSTSNSSLHPPKQHSQTFIAILGIKGVYFASVTLYQDHIYRLAHRQPAPSPCPARPASTSENSSSSYQIVSDHPHCAFQGCGKRPIPQPTEHVSHSVCHSIQFPEVAAIMRYN